MADFRGALLVKRWRAAGPLDEEAEDAINEALSHGVDNVLEYLIKKHGTEKGKTLYSRAEMATCIESSWECRETRKLIHLELNLK